MTRFSNVPLTHEDVPGLIKAVRMILEVERLAGHTIEAEMRRRNYKFLRGLISHEVGAFRAANPLEAARAGSEVYDLGREDYEEGAHVEGEAD